MAGSEPTPADLIEEAARLHLEASRLFRLHGDEASADEQQRLAEAALRASKEARLAERHE